MTYGDLRDPFEWEHTASDDTPSPPEYDGES